MDESRISFAYWESSKKKKEYKGLVWLCTKYMIKGSIRQARSSFYTDMKQNKKLYANAMSHLFKPFYFKKKKKKIIYFISSFVFFNWIIKKNIYIYIPMQRLSLALYTNFISNIAFVQNCISNKALVWLCTQFYFIQRHKDMLCSFYDLRLTMLVFR